MKRGWRTFLFLALMLQAHMVHAGVSINEIMYDVPGTDTDREWIEVYNTGDTGVDLSKYKFFESSANHALSLFSGDALLSPGGYAVIASNPTKFKTDWPAFSGSLFDSSFSLSNEGEYMAMKNENLEIVDEVTYDISVGGAGDGNTLSKSSTQWVPLAASPGKENTTNSADVNQDTEEVNSVSTNSSGPSTQNTILPTKNTYLEVSVGNPVLVDVPVDFKASAFGVNDEKLVYGKFVWNFGDGVNQTQYLYDANTLYHTYLYEGVYTVTVEYFAGEYLPKANAQKRFTVNAILAPISITKIGNQEDFFIEISNNSINDIDISKWSIRSDKQIFYIPQNTILAKKQKIIFSPRVTGFLYQDGATVSILNQNNNEVFRYSYSQKTKSDRVPNSVRSARTNVSSGTIKDTSAEKDFVDLSSAGASVISSQASVAQESFYKNLYIYILFVLIIVVAILVTFFLRRMQKENPEDFEILDE